jgi:RNA polymerase sigma factor (sigma-70 family)
VTREVQAKAVHLSRRIYASLPWGFRVAQLFLKLSFSITDTLGKVVYAQFALAGVEGLPPIKGQDALSMPETLFKHPERLPTGYGKNFANQIYAYLLKKTRNPAKVEEVISEMLMRITKGFDLRNGIPLGQAESYVFRLANFALTDVMRKKQRGDVSLDSPTDDEDYRLDPADPQTYRDLEDLIPQSELNDILRAIGKVHPKAVDWFKGQLEGVTNRDLAEQWGVSEPRVNQLVHVIEPAVKKILQQHLQ